MKRAFDDYGIVPGRGTSGLAPTYPLRGEAWIECPITGLRFPESEGRWRRGRLVHPSAFDAPGYRERIIEKAPHNIKTKTRRMKPLSIGQF